MISFKYKPKVCFHNVLNEYNASFKWTHLSSLRDDILSFLQSLHRVVFCTFHHQDVANQESRRLLARLVHTISLWIARHSHHKFWNRVPMIPSCPNLKKNFGGITYFFFKLMTNHYAVICIQWLELQISLGGFFLLVPVMCFSSLEITSTGLCVAVNCDLSDAIPTQGRINLGHRWTLYTCPVTWDGSASTRYRALTKLCGEDPFWNEGKSECICA